MDIDLDVPAVDIDAQPFFDLNEPVNFDFELNSQEFNPSMDPFVTKEAFSSPSDDTLFDEASASPLRTDAVADPYSDYNPVPIDDSEAAEQSNMVFDASETSPMEGVVPSAQSSFDESSQHSAPGQDISYAESRDSDSEGTSRRGRKRKAPVAANVNEKRSRMRLEPGVVIPKDDLIKLSAEELEEYATHIQNSNLPANEKNEIRKQLRLVKNRESAQASRLRKKNYIDDLERRVAQLQTENTSLRNNVNSLNNENNQLKSEVVYLKGVVNNSGLSKVLSQGQSFFSKLSQHQQQQQQNKSSTAAPAFNARTTGVVLMVMLFSFGLLFNSQSGLKQTPIALPGPSSAEAPGRIVHADYKPTSEVRDVLSVLDNSEMPTQRIRQMVEKQRAMPDSSSHKVVEERRVPVTEKALVKPKEEASVQQLPVMADADWKANTTYLLCPSVQKMTPPIKATEDDTFLPMQIAFLIPPESLGAGEAPAGSGRLGSMLEVTCQVVDVVSRPYMSSQIKA